MKKAIKLTSSLLLIWFLFILVSCVNPKEDKKDHIIYNETLSPYIIIKGTTRHILDFEGKQEQSSKFDMFLDVNTQNSNNEFYYKVDVKDAHGRLNLVRDNLDVKNILPYNGQIMFDQSMGGNGFSTIELQINYSEETYEFYEEILGFIDKKTKRRDYKEKLDTKDFELEFNVSFDDEKYIYSLTINSKNIKHLDYQSFLVSSNEKVFSHLGIYSYYRNDFPLIIDNNYIYKDMDIKYIYLRVRYYNEDNNETIVNYKVLINDLINM